MIMIMIMIIGRASSDNQSSPDPPSMTGPTQEPAISNATQNQKLTNTQLWAGSPAQDAVTASTNQKVKGSPPRSADMAVSTTASAAPTNVSYTTDFPSLGSSSQTKAPAAIPSKSAWGAPRSQTQQPNQSSAFETTTEQPATSHKTLAQNAHQPTYTTRELPRGVYIVCDHFLHKHGTRPASVYEKNKACKGCENRSKLQYAFWCETQKQWKLPRPLPDGVKAAFQLCTYYTMNKRCAKEPCTFAHGPGELLIWTMRREGGMNKFN